MKTLSVLLIPLYLLLPNIAQAVMTEPYRLCANDAEGDDEEEVQQETNDEECS